MGDIKFSLFFLIVGLCVFVGFGLFHSTVEAWEEPVEKTSHSYVPSGAAPHIYCTDTSDFDLSLFVAEIDLVLESGDTVRAIFSPNDFIMGGRSLVMYKNLHPKLDRVNVPVEYSVTDDGCYVIRNAAYPF
jgi:hypothetical protein